MLKASWREKFHEEFEQEYFKGLLCSVNKEYEESKSHSMDRTERKLVIVPMLE